MNCVSNDTSRLLLTLAWCQSPGRDDVRSSLTPSRDTTSTGTVAPTGHVTSGPRTGLGTSGFGDSPDTPGYTQQELDSIADPLRRRLVIFFSEGQPASVKKSKGKGKAVANTAAIEDIEGSSQAAATQLDISEDEQNAILRRLDRQTRWHSFLYHSNMFGHDLILELYNTPDVIDSSYYIIARTKIQDSVKNYKKRTLANLEVSTSLGTYRGMVLT